MRLIYILILGFFFLNFCAHAGSEYLGIRSIFVPFIKNEGQVDSRIKFYTKIPGGMLFITGNGELVYNFSVVKWQRKKWFVGLKEVLKKAKVEKVVGIEKSETEVSYFVGRDEKKWKTGIKTFRVISFGEVYEGISLKLRVYNGGIEKIFEVKPGADPKKIAFRVEGATDIRFNDKTGELVIKTSMGEIRLARLEAYQEINGKRVNVALRYRPLSKIYMFDIGKYDKTKTLVIRIPFAYTHLESYVADHVKSLAIDQEGYVYVVGNTYWLDMPTKAGTYPYDGGVDGNIFIAKLTGDLSKFITYTYIGGSMGDFVHSVAVDSSGNIYIGGYTWSEDFPVTEGAYQTSKSGRVDTFILKLSNDLKRLIASTYIGGSRGDYADSMVLDSKGNVYIAGTTWSTDFPITKGAYQTNNRGNGDVFVSKLSNDLGRLIASTYFGGSERENLRSLAIGPDGSVFIAGITLSRDLPITSDSYDQRWSGWDDSFVSKLSGDLTELLASTYLGGSERDYIYSMATDKEGNVYVTGYTESPDFPSTKGAYQICYGMGDVFISKFDRKLADLVASTCLRGDSWEYAYSIAVDSNGDVYVVGYTHSLDFPITEGAYQINHKGGTTDIFISRLTNNLKKLIASTYLGGSEEDYAYSIAIGPKGNLYIAGCTLSLDFFSKGCICPPANRDYIHRVFVLRLGVDLSK